MRHSSHYIHHTIPSCQNLLYLTPTLFSQQKISTMVINMSPLTHFLQNVNCKTSGYKLTPIRNHNYCCWQLPSPIELLHCIYIPVFTTKKYCYYRMIHDINYEIISHTPYHYHNNLSTTTTTTMPSYNLVSHNNHNLYKKCTQTCLISL